MKHFITFQKRKKIAVPTVNTMADNSGLVKQINHELMRYGFMLTQDLFDALKVMPPSFLNEVYNDLMSAIERAAGSDGFEPIYRNFPQSVVEMSQAEFVFNAIVHYWSFGSWRPEDEGHLQRERKLEFVEYTPIGLMSESEFNDIFYDIIYSGNSISAFDKEIISFFIMGNVPLNFGKISFNETKAYVGQKLLDSETTVLPTKDATMLLRMWSLYSGGDEGLKTNTRFKNPKAFQRRMLLRTLDQCFNLEESFKLYREKWLRLLFYLHPMQKGKDLAYPNVYQYAFKLRNSPKELRTFNSYVEEKLANKDESVFDLLKQRKGVFLRRLDHLVRTFGGVAIEKWLQCEPTFAQRVEAYNHFSGRAKAQSGRGAVLAGQGTSEVVTYDALEPLDKGLVETIKRVLMTSLKQSAQVNLSDTVYIDKSLYFSPLAINNRASSFALTDKAIGTVEKIDDLSKTIRMFVHWHGKDDLDFTAMVITNKNEVTKVGWNSAKSFAGDAVVYSGDNTGYSAKNAEYIDVTPSKLPDDVEWIIIDTVMYRPKTKKFSAFKEKVRTGWMVRAYPEANEHWKPETLVNSMELNSDSSSAYLAALHVPTGNFVYLDVSNTNTNVTNASDAIKMRTFLDSFVTLDTGAEEINWEKLNQGHVLNLLHGGRVTTDPGQATKVFDENTTWEKVSRLLTT